jgi:hypothetical protein
MPFIMLLIIGFVLLLYSTVAFIAYIVTFGFLFFVPSIYLYKEEERDGEIKNIFFLEE